MIGLSYRSATLELSENDAITVSFSSEATYPRMMQGKLVNEVLSHNDGDYDFTRINSGNAPFLLDHESDEHENHIGVIESAGVIDKRGIAVVRFSSDEKKQAIINDIKTGIRPNISVGYIVTSCTDEGAASESDGIPTYRCKWTPMEISSVAIPADWNVGANRSKENLLSTKQDITMSEITTVVDTTKDETKVTPIEPVSEIRSAAPADVMEICKRNGLTMDRAIEYVKSGATLLEIREKIVSEVEAQQAATRFATGQAPNVHTSEKPSYSFGRAFVAATTGQWDTAGYEREMSQELARAQGRAFTGNNFFIDPLTPLKRAAGSGAVANALGGAEMVGQQFMPENLIELLYAKTVSSQLGVRKMLGLNQNIRIPKITAGTIATWGAERAIAATSRLDTDKLDMTPNQLTVKSIFTRQLLTQGLPNIEALVTNDIYRQIALAVDTVIVNGSGVGSQPLGVLNQPGIAVVAAGANGGLASWGGLNNLIRAVDNANALNGSLKFLGNPKVSSHLRTTLKDTNTAAIYLMGDSDKTVGYDYYSSTIVPSNLVKGTSGAICSPLIFGNWDDVMLAQWGAIEMTVDPYTAGDTSEIVLRAYSFWDVDVRHQESFAAYKDLLA